MEMLRRLLVLAISLSLAHLSPGLPDYSLFPHLLLPSSFRGVGNPDKHMNGMKGFAGARSLSGLRVLRVALKGLSFLPHMHGGRFPHEL